MAVIFNYIKQAKTTSQHPVYHPEGNVQNHLLQTFYHAVRESNDVNCLIAALTHDIGKVIEHIGHEDYSVKILDGLAIFSDKTIWLVGNHMRIITYLNGDMKKYKKTQELVNSPWFTDLIQLHRWDHLGRNPNRNIVFDEDDILDKLNGGVG